MGRRAIASSRRTWRTRGCGPEMTITIHNIVEEGAHQHGPKESERETRPAAVVKRAPPRYQPASIVNVYLPEDVVQAIDALRDKDGRTRSELIAGILKSHMRALPDDVDRSPGPSTSIASRDSR